MADNKTLRCAVWYARHLGWHVFPCHSIRDGRCTCGDIECKSAGKHPLTPHGCKDASADPAVLEEWWREWPDANIAMATGEPSRVDALDVDPRNGGDETLWELEGKHGELPATVASLTGGGGCHRFFQYVQGLRNGEIAPGLDLKTTGGYVILPPSAHTSGQRYLWQGASRPDETAVAPWPPWLLELAHGRVNGQGQAVGTVADKIPRGQRNSTLTSVGGSLRRRGLDAEEILATLRVVNERRCDPPLADDDLGRIAQSLAQYEPDAPKQAARPVQGQSLRVEDVPSVWAYEVELQWLVEGLIPTAAVTLLSGDSGVGKSTLALALAAAVAQGRNFLDRVCQRGEVLYLDRENPLAAVKERLRRLGITPMESLRIWGGWVPQGPPGPGAAEILRYAREHTPLIVADSLIGFHDGSEQDASETRRFLDQFRRLANQGATVLLIHHTGKADTAREYRGSSDIKASVDMAYVLQGLTSSSKLDKLRLRGFKSRVAPVENLIIEYEDGVGFRLCQDPRVTLATTARDLVVQIVHESPGCGREHVIAEARRRGAGRDDARTVLADLEREGLLCVAQGERGRKTYRPQADEWLEL